MAHRYRITVEALDTDPTQDTRHLAFEATNHDDLFVILEKLRAKALVPQEETAAFAIGLKLFTECLIHNRKSPPFERLWPHMGAFMKELKALPAPDHASAQTSAD